MTIRNTGSRRTNSPAASSSNRDRLQRRRRELVRRSLLETLEQRQLFAVGPQLTGIQPNDGSLLFDGSTLTVAPRELVFRFDDSTSIDATTLNGIRITRAGADGVFESATATTDFGTLGVAIVEFRSLVPGASGNGQQILITTANRTGSSLPIIRESAGVIEIELNSNPARVSRVQDMITALAGSSAASKVEAVLVSGPSLTAIGTTATSGKVLTLQGANAAQALTELGTTNGTLVRLIAVNPGAEGRGVQINVTKRDFGGPANPVVTVQGMTIGVQVNSSTGFVSTVNDFINAINNNPEASLLVQAVLEAGSASTSLATLPSNFAPLLLSGAGDIVLSPGYVGLGDTAREVVFRFNENLPDDDYRIDILGAGANALTNVLGEGFNGGADMGIQFSLNLGPQVLAVVPEPVRRGTNGVLAQAAGTIDVHFSDDDLLPSAAINVNYYQLVFKSSLGTDIVIKPSSVTYSRLTNVATLQFSSALSRIVDPTSASGAFLQGAFRLRVGTSENLSAAPILVNAPVDSGETFGTSYSLDTDLGSLANGTRSLIVNGSIENQAPFAFELPGGQGTPGRREVRPEDVSRFVGPLPLDYYRLDVDGDLVGDADSVDGISEFVYSFPLSYLGPDPATGGATNKTYFSVITEEQKIRIREAMTMFSEYLGIQFIERLDTADAGGNVTRIVVGDLYSANGDADSGQGGANDIVAALRPDGADTNVFPDLGVLDFQNFDESDDDRFGGEFSRGAFLLVGQLLGYGYGDDLPQPVTQSSTFVLNPGSATEATFPSVVDILHGQYLYRPESSDIDLYSFTLDQPGHVSAETFAERSPEVSLLDTTLRLYRFNAATNGYDEVAANDDYSSNDSLVDLELPAGRYVLGVSASGNAGYNPVISGTGFGGRSEGEYQLRLTVRPVRPQGLVDTTGIPLDGDADGTPGGVFDFWYQSAEPLNPSLRQLELQVPGGAVTPATIFVDKAAAANGTGALTSPLKEIDLAIAIARPGDIIRVVANGGADGRISTPEDNLSYQIGVNSLGQTLADGRSIEVPKGVTMVVDAGAVLKFRNSHITVGSNSPTVDRSGSALMVLGTPVIVESNGLVATDSLREPIPGSVYMTSYNDRTLGIGNSPSNLAVQSGDWGGIDFRGDLDSADESRVNLEAQGIFLNQIYGADIRYGGGQVSVVGRPIAISPIEIDILRPTIAHSKISRSSSAAIEATPNSFIESTFMEYVRPGETGYTPDFSRVGPDIHNNTIVNNSINGMQIRVTTRTGEGVTTLQGQARFDDTDIVHVLTENLVIAGTPGGPVIESVIPPALLIRTAASAGGFLAPATYVYRIAYVDANGNETPASEATVPLTTLSTGAITLTQLPTVPANSDFTSRRLYRATVGNGGVVGDFRLAGVLNGGNTTFVDNGNLSGSLLIDRPVQLRARLDARLAIDPGMVIKLDGARMETTFGANFIAEGSDGLPIVFTGMNDGRYGAAGSFKTDSKSEIDELSVGDWGGLYFGYATSANLDYARISGAGGVTRIEGGFASFNAIEVHQADFRMSNSRLELNDSGTEVPHPDRAGRGANDAGTVFVRGASPTIINNQILTGVGVGITIDVNSMGFAAQDDPGRATGALDRLDVRGNLGPMIRGNSLDGNGINGLHVRGGETTTEIVFDDVDVVHVVLDTITISNQHVFGGMRLQSNPEASLVVKFESRNNDTAGLVVGGSLLTSTGQLAAISDRIGGSLQLVGFPDFPVILTTLADDSVGAGFTATGEAQVDTNNDGLFGAGQPTLEGFAQLPFGPEVNNGLRIDNDVSQRLPGFFEVTPDAGGEVNLGNSGVTVNSLGGILIDQDYIFDFLNVIDVGANGGGISLGTTTITEQPRLVSDDRVRSRGNFQGQNGLVNWTVDTYLLDGVPVLFNSITFESSQTLGSLRVINYLDEDVEAVNDDVLFTVGTPGEADFRAYTVDNARRIGFAQGGYYEEDGRLLTNASYVGWAADTFRNLLTDIETAGTFYTPAGNIDLTTLPQGTDAQFGTIYGPGDVTTAFAWDVNPTSFTATITSFLELLPRDPSAASAQVESGLWQGVTVREGASDRNVVGTPENEPTTRVSETGNAIPGNAQFLGELAGASRGGDENQRLGFVVDGHVSTTSDVDVYAFVGRAGSEVWFDIDRTQMSLDSVVELIDANGNVLASSDNSAAESLDPTLLYRSDALNAIAVNPMNSIPLTSSLLADAQDGYSVNPKDAGLRIVLPGSEGSRNLYHVRVRSSNADGGDQVPNGANSPLVRAGLTTGSYRLQVRLREQDEFPGTQIRIGDVRYAQTNLQIIGQPFHSPLLGEAQEVSESSGLATNNLRANAQPLGPYALNSNIANPAASNLVASDRLSLTVGGDISSETDVDWFQFNIDYQQLPAGTVSQYLSTVFDIDYADGYARADMSLYVFDSAGRLLLAGLDSNIAEDQPSAGAGADSSDLSRGSAGTNDPYIGMAELPSGTYFVAVTNNRNAPRVLNQLYAPGTNPNVTVDPLLRLEPLASVRRIAEDHIGGDAGRAAVDPTGVNQPQLLFDNQSIVPHSLDDLVMYSWATGGSGDSLSLSMSNPYNGTFYGGFGTLNNPGYFIRDIAIRPDGQIYAYRYGATDLETVYVQINSETGVQTVINPAEILTTDVGVGVGIRVQALTFLDNSFGLMIGQRGTGTIQTDDVYDRNILYRFDANSGVVLSAPALDRDDYVLGARTDKVERGYINTDRNNPNFNGIVMDVSAATLIDAAGIATRRIIDGMQFRVGGAAGVTFEFNSGPDLLVDYNADAGRFVNDGTQYTVNGVLYEFETGGAIQLQSGANIQDGSTVRVTSQATGLSTTFELTLDATAASGNVAVRYSNTMTAAAVSSALATAISQAGIGIVADVLGQTGRIAISGDSTTVATTTTGAGITYVGGHGLITPTAIPVTLEEGVSQQSFMDEIVASTVGDVAVGVAGNRMNFRGAIGLNDFSGVGSGIFLVSAADSAVTQNTTAIDFLASDDASTIAQRIARAVNAAFAAGGTVATPQGRSISFTRVVNAGLETPNVLRLQNTATNAGQGGDVTGLSMLNGRLYAVTDTGRMFVVDDPANGNADAAPDFAPGPIGTYVHTATDLLGINFSSMTNGPNLNYVDTWTTPGVSVVRSMSNLFFGSTTAGVIHAFNADGVLQPVFAGGRTNVATGVGFTDGILLSTLDRNLWHVNDDLANPPAGNPNGNGVNADPFLGTGAIDSTRSLHFGTGAGGSYGFPGGASGVMETTQFSLAGYSPADQPYLYFNYLLSTDGVDGLSDDRDALHVYVLKPNGEAVLVATNNVATGGGIADDALDPVTGAAVTPLLDNADWRQARVALSEFAGLEDLKLRIEFATAGQALNGTLQLRTGRGDLYEDGQTLTVGGRVIELDYGPQMVLSSGLSFAEFYAVADGGVAGSQPAARVVVDVGGKKFVLTDGLRTIAAGEVAVLLAVADDPATTVNEAKTISQLTATDIATLLRTAILANRPDAVVMPGTVNVSAEPNDKISKAVRLDRAPADTIINGSGRIGTAQGTELNDVDMSRIRLLAGESLTVNVQRTGGAIAPNIRIFNAAGRELSSTVGNGTSAVLTYTATEDMEVFIGISTSSSRVYDPNIANTVLSTTAGGTYSVVFSTSNAFDVLQIGNRLQVVGVSGATSSDATLVRTSGELGVEDGHLRLPLTIEDTAAEVAALLRGLLVKHFSNGVNGAFETFGSTIEMGTLTVNDEGPFNLLGNGGNELRGDRFGSLGPGRAINNNGQGVYLDDFIIGFAERGEMVTGASLIANRDVFAPSLDRLVSNPPAPGTDLVTGSYQLEIRDGSEYLRYVYPADEDPFPEYFRTMDTNDRRAEGVTSLIAPAASSLVDGMTFSINDSVRQLTFEFDLEGSTGGVTAGRVRVPFDGSTTSSRSANDVAAAIVAAINSPSVQSLLQVSASVKIGADGLVAGPVVELAGRVVVTDNSGLLTIVAGTGRGDTNRELDDQGVIIVESSRFSFASGYGIDLDHSAGGTANPNLVRYPRNLVELSSDGQIPGVVIQSNVIAYNGSGAIRINGLTDQQSLASINPVPVDRIVNNTLVGGRISAGESAPATVFQGLLFPSGTVSFADSIVSYTPGSGGGPSPDTLFQNSANALGAPDVTNSGAEPTTNTGSVSLGYGGSMTVQFTNNYLTGDGTSAPDLAIFEVGAIESVSVSVSRDGTIFIPVGTVGGLTNRIDLDAFGFTAQDRLSFVRLTDLRQGDRNALAVGADIDAIGALSTVSADVYTAGGIGIDVTNNAAPTIINNVLANFDTGVRADSSSDQTVSGGNALYRNTLNLDGTAQLGQATQVLNSALNIFVSPTEMVFDPAAGSPLIDSSFDSLLDRPSMATVRGAIGLEVSPVLAPRLDVNGQLRVDDPNVDSPSGVGENVFKDRGAADRADQAGPVGRLIVPADNDAAGLDTNSAVNVVSFFGKTTNAFEIQLIDGTSPNDPVPGVGIADGSVTSSAVLVFRDNEPLVEGVDYLFSYQASSNVIRLTPLAGVWKGDAVYTIRLLDSDDSVLVAADGDQYTDGDSISIIDEAGGLTVLEVETGINLTVPTLNGLPVITDGTSFTIYDGTRSVTFETDTNNAVITGRIPVVLRSNMLLESVTAAYVAAINGAGINLTATASDGVIIQLTGSHPLSNVDPIDSGLGVSGAIGVATGYGLQIPTAAGTNTPTGLVDGQTFAIRRGPFQIVNFEINTAGGLTNAGYVPVAFAAGASLDVIASALVRAIGGAGIGLSPTNAGFGRVALNGDASYSVELTNTVLQVVGAPGQMASTALPISVAPTATASVIAQQVAAAILAEQPAGVSLSVIGPRIIINGAQGITGAGALNLVSIRDRVGNLLQSNQEDGTTVFTIFLGSGFDYGDAPDPEYASKQASGGARHVVTPELTLGATVTPDADAAANDSDSDDGISLSGVVYSGFDANFQVIINAQAGADFALDYWIDWNGDGVFAAAEKGARLTNTTGLSIGSNNLSLVVPTLGTAADGRALYSVAGQTYARFRLSSAGVSSATGDAADGEVEDFQFNIQVNPFQNSNGRFDVNASGDVSPIDILQIVNVLNRSNSNSIDLDPSQQQAGVPPYLDVNGDGKVQPIDALAVLNYIERTVLGRGNGEGEGAGRAYQMTSAGVFASAATVLGSVGAAPFANSGLQAEGEGSAATTGAADLSRFSASSTSVFDSSATMSLDDILDTIATAPRGSVANGEFADGSSAEGSEDAEELSPFDAIFNELGR